MMGANGNGRHEPEPRILDTAEADEVADRLRRLGGAALAMVSDEGLEAFVATLERSERRASLLLQPPPPEAIAHLRLVLKHARALRDFRNALREGVTL